MVDPLDPLHAELETFHENRSAWAAEEGRFVVISGKTVHGFYDTYSDALTEGYKEYGLATFLVKQITTIADIANFTRHILPACHTSAA